MMVLCLNAFIVHVAACLLALSAATVDPRSAYFARRSALVNHNRAHRFDATIELTLAEQALDQRMSGLRQLELAHYAGHESYPFEQNFRDAHSAILKSSLYPILNSMPKGALLHTHSLFDGRQLFSNATALRTCWLNNGSSGIVPSGHYFFSESEPLSSQGEQWVNVRAARLKASDPAAFDEILFQSLQFYTPPKKDISENQMWVMFDAPIFRQTSLANYVKTYRWAFYHALDMLVKGGLQHVEYRWPHGVLYDLDGTTHYEIDVALAVLRQYNQDHPSLRTPLTIKFIWEVNRNSNSSTILSQLKQAVELKRRYQSVAGFDLVDQEDWKGPLVEFVDDFIAIDAYTKALGEAPLKYFFHAGESNWHKGAAENMYDAVLLNTSRIGHGFALLEYPELMRLVRERGIGIEVCPISNQMLRLVDDIRLHPASFMLEHGMPITLSSDNGPTYGYTGNTMDFWMGYMAWNISLNGLKQLGLNSLTYSALDPNEKSAALDAFREAWQSWVGSQLTLSYV